MGRAALLTLVAALAACARPAPPTDGLDPHATLACTQCHQGELADRAQASVPSDACAASGCHDRGIASVSLMASVPFDHQAHEEAEGVEVGCAGCHTHPAGRQTLTAGAATCGLCHASEIAGDRPADCRVCHASPSHEGTTSQSVQVPHVGLPWIEGGCLRCHYQVATPVQQVDLGRCAACHEDVRRVAAAGIGEDLHPAHVGSACIACHEEDEHRIAAMSSAVDLRCAHCHVSEHGIELASAEPVSETCADCHRDTHADPQRLVLGIVPLAGATAPSDHFMDGLTCRSCHADPPRAGEARGASGAACATCHRREYAVVERWWAQGVRERLTIVDRYVSGAESATAARAADDPARVAAARARELVGLIQRGGGAHNIALAHRMLEEALADAAEAYQLAGRGPPSAPSLGRAPRQGLCSYCHYRTNEPGLSEQMDDAFHRAVLGGG